MLVHNFWETNGKETNWEFLQSLCISTNFGGQKWNRVDVMWWRRLPYSLCVLPSTAGGAIGVRLGPRPLTSLGIIFWDHHWKPLETIGNDTHRSSVEIGQIQKETDLLRKINNFEYAHQDVVSQRRFLVLVRDWHHTSGDRYYPHSSQTRKCLMVSVKFTRFGC